MKTKLIFTISLCLLGLNLVAQTNDITPLKIGDKVPELVLKNIKNGSISTASLSDLSKPGLLIINFWATYCVPCVQAMPTFNSLNNPSNSNKSKFNMLFVTNEDSRKISNFIVNHKKDVNNLSFLADDRILEKYFPHASIPQNYWIDRDGILRAVTEDFEVNAKNINALLENKNFQVVDLPEYKEFDMTKPLQVPDSLLEYRSLISRFNESIRLGGGGFIATGYRSFNLPKPMILWGAFTGRNFLNKHHDLIHIITTDSASFFDPKYLKEPGWSTKNDGALSKDLQKWQRDNYFCYELFINEKKKKIDVASCMARDLSTYFNLEGKLEERETFCWVIRKIPGRIVPEHSKEVTITPLYIDPSKTSLIVKKQTLKDIALAFDEKWGSQPPIVDRTGIDYPIDLNLKFDKEGPIKAYYVEILIKRLEEIGLSMTKEKIMYPHLIIVDKNKIVSKQRGS
jgi:thiol-disulfide isomerase/thioredoxin